MLIMIPAGSQIVAKVEAGVWKPVRCLHCGAEFVYRMTRTAKGEAPIDLGDRAGLAAEWDARANAQIRLLRECDAVPCPDCGRYQEDMVRMLKFRRFRWSLYPGLALLTGAALSYVAELPNRSEIIPNAVKLAWVVMPGIALLLLAAGAVLWQLQRPNAGDLSARTRSGPPSGNGPFSRMEFESIRDQMAAQGYGIGMILPPLAMVFGKPQTPRPREFHPPDGPAGDDAHPS